jgi:hypothetical protein
MNRRELLIRSPLALAAASLDLDLNPLWAQSAPALRYPLNQSLLISLENSIGPCLTRVANGSGTGADVRLVQAQISALRTELMRVGVAPPFQYACSKFSGSDPRLSCSAVANMVTQITQQWAPSVSYIQVHRTYLTMAQYNPALPPLKQVGIMQGSLNTLAIEGLDAYLGQVWNALQTVSNVIYGNFFTATTCSEIKYALFFLTAALVVLSGICLLTGVLVEICPLVRIIGFVVGFVGILIRAMLCGI